jgi:hypothetical protein
MGYLLTNQLDTTNITIYENLYSHKIIYKLPYLTLYGLYLRIYGTNISCNSTNYTIFIKDQNSLSLLTMIDTYFGKLKNYKPLLKNNYFTIKKNPIVDKLVTKYKDVDYIDINIFKINNYASHPYLLVYIL